MKLIFEEVMTEELLDLLDEDLLDVGILATPVERGNIYEEELYYEPFVGYISRDHPLAEKDKLTVDDLDAANLWLLNEGHCFRDQTVKLCKKQRRELLNNTQIEFESGNLETLKQLVEQDFGMTLLPFLARNQIDEQCARAHLRYFTEPAPRRKVRLAYGQKFLKRNIVQAFLEEIRGAIPEELSSPKDALIVE
ncbi:MAG: LysR substrate-binding domain-containing protein [Balneolaceae bacterium]|nr:LysR substrate-binding domain-containing protein [Balneolaceae bacterium]